ncbi:hypothetical protein PT7_0854 [Pusillimonas sp. T7-7]|nr:hypothetical protein PT7_0854 [Pusillimonas sp. T7-7]
MQDLKLEEQYGRPGEGNGSMRSFQEGLSSHSYPNLRQSSKKKRQRFAIVYRRLYCLRCLAKRRLTRAASPFCSARPPRRLMLRPLQTLPFFLGIHHENFCFFTADLSILGRPRRFRTR